VANLIAEKASAKGLELVFDVDKNVPVSWSAIRCGWDRF